MWLTQVLPPAKETELLFQQSRLPGPPSSGESYGNILNMSWMNLGYVWYDFRKRFGYV